MTGCDLAARAKAGDVAAVNELLRAITPHIRRIAFRALVSRGAPMSLLDDAVAEGLIVAWKAIPNWNPRVTLSDFAAVAIRGAVHEVVSGESYAVRLGENYAPTQAQNIAAREAAKAVPMSLDAPIGDGNLTLADVLPGHHVDAAAQHDAATALSRAKPAQAEILWRVACGEEYSEIAADHGCTKQHIHQQHARTIETLRRRLNPRKAA